MVWLACYSFPLTFCLAQSRYDDAVKTSTPSTVQAANSPTDAWCAPAASLPFPNKAAYGRVYNHPFKIDQGIFTYEPVVVGQGKKKRSLVLVLQQGAIPCGTESYLGIKRVTFSRPRVAFKINFWRGDLSSLAGKTIVVKAGSPIDARASYPMVTVETNTVAKQGSSTYAADMAWPTTSKTYLIGGTKYGYGMRLAFSQMQGDRLPGYIVLRVADPEHSFIEGYFYATVKDDWTSFRHMKPLENLNATGEFPSGN